ncbi:MAG: hypothetical protein KDM63_06590 [Verrucomicrobiae bacterium]|nr:hypothetical protein [Verrucomicrobiae bacterium]
MELDPIRSLVVKITEPPKFGLIPKVVRHPVVDIRADSPGLDYREAIEFVAATASEYLDRWCAANDVFSDSVRLAAVVAWPDGEVSFVITQPQYHGKPAEPREIEAYFCESAWRHVRDPSGQHSLFFNYGSGVLAVDAVPRNCYINDGRLQPFDVILCRPGAELERYLRLYPDS